MTQEIKKSIEDYSRNIKELQFETWEFIKEYILQPLRNSGATTDVITSTVIQALNQNGWQGWTKESITEAISDYLED